MPRTILKWALFSVAGVVLGPVVYHLIRATSAPDGSDQVTALLSASPARSVAFTLLCLAFAGGIGFVTGRLVSPRSGMFASGLVLVWAAASGGHLEAVIRRTHSSSTLVTLAIEGALLGLAGLIIARLASSREKPPVPTRGVLTPPLGPGVGVIVGAFAAWAVARSGMTGQTVAAAAAAGLVGTLVGTVVDQRSALWTYAGMGIVLAFAGPMVAKVMHADRIVEAVYSGAVVALARPSPMDWLAGILLGVPMGDAWAASMLERKSGTPVSPGPKAA